MYDYHTVKNPNAAQEAKSITHPNYPTLHQHKTPIHSYLHARKVRTLYRAKAANANTTDRAMAIEFMIDTDDAAGAKPVASAGWLVVAVPLPLAAGAALPFAPLGLTPLGVALPDGLPLGLPLGLVVLVLDEGDGVAEGSSTLLGQLRS